MNERFRSPEEKSFHVFHSAASWSPLTRYIPLVAGDNSGQGSRLHQSLAIRVSGKIQSLPVTEPRMALVSAPRRPLSRWQLNWRVYQGCIGMFWDSEMDSYCAWRRVEKYLHLNDLGTTVIRMFRYRILSEFSTKKMFPFQDSWNQSKRMKVRKYGLSFI